MNKKLLFLFLSFAVAAYAMDPAMKSTINEQCVSMNKKIAGEMQRISIRCAEGYGVILGNHFEELMNSDDDAAITAVWDMEKNNVLDLMLGAVNSFDLGAFIPEGVPAHQRDQLSSQLKESLPAMMRTMAEDTGRCAFAMQVKTFRKAYAVYKAKAVKEFFDQNNNDNESEKD